VATPLPRSGWDDIVVGAGTAGAVLAGRLAAQPDRRVLLIEAGPDPAGPHRPPDRLGIPVVTGWNWDHTVHIGPDTTGRVSPYPSGKLVGGTAAINGAIALRGLPRDFDAWAAAGNPEWSWRAVRPHYIRLETDVDMDGQAHGRQGPVPIRRADPARLGPLASGFLDACAGLGLPLVADLNAGPAVGAGPVPTNGRGCRRLSTADTHLAAVRGRPNLTIWAGSPVGRVLLRGGRARGVEVLRDGVPQRVSGDRVTLAAGGIYTPALLLRSGIGDPRQLRALGIAVHVPLAGVGGNLIEHPAVPVWTVPHPGVSRPGDAWYQVMARAATGHRGADVGIVLAGNIDPGTLLEAGAALGGQPAAMVSAVLLDPDARGRVRLRDAAADTPPLVTLNLAGTPGDVERLIAAVRLTWSVVRSAAFNAQLRRVLVWTERMVHDDALLRSSLTRWSVPLFHAAGTARMGPADDPAAVVDQRCRVHHVDNLMLCDASVMPLPVSAPPSLTCVMIAERVAQWMSGGPP
jgi:choline dehydrogenase